MAMTLISRTTLTGTAASVTFSSIPQTYQTLKIICSMRSTYSGGTGLNASVYYSINGSSASQSGRYINGSGSAAASGTTTTAIISKLNGASMTASTFGNSEITFPNYAGSTNKPITVDSVSENNATAAWQELGASLKSDTAAITSVTLTTDNDFLANSTFSLYGVS